MDVFPLSLGLFSFGVLASIFYPYSKLFAHGAKDSFSLAFPSASFYLASTCSDSLYSIRLFFFELSPNE